MRPQPAKGRLEAARHERRDPRPLRRRQGIFPRTRVPAGEPIGIKQARAGPDGAGAEVLQEVGVTAAHLAQVAAQGLVQPEAQQDQHHHNPADAQV